MTLKEYFAAVAQHLKEGRRVYLCPVSLETSLAARILRNEYGVSPSGFCDNDARKQGKRLNSLPDLEIFSFDQALEDPEAEFLVISPFHSADMIGNLTLERGVAPGRILNSHPIERRKTCARFAQNWMIADQTYYCCCMENMPTFPHDPQDPERGADTLEQVRNGLIDGTVPLPEQCLTCYHNRDSFLYASRKLNSFNFSFQGWCNYKCDYCSAHQPDRKNYNAKFYLEEYLTALEKRDMVNDIFSVLFATGEPTLNEKRFPLYRHCGEKGYYLDVFSNCSVFDQALFDLAQESPVIIRKSFDAGTPESYARIKGVNCWEKMLENLRRYVRAPYLALNPKYLFVPGINDNETDVENFVQICAELKVDFVTPVFSFLGSDYEKSDQAKRMFKLLVDRLAECGIFTANVDTLYDENYHKLYQASF